MKKIISVLAVLTLALGVACARTDKPIKFSQLPATAQEFIKKHFASSTVALAKIDDELLYKEYEVMFTDGTKLEFGGDGEWKEVYCSDGAVPAAIIPKQILDYVKRNYPEAKIKKIDRDKRDYEVSLSNRLELTFDMKFNLVDIDD